jgi:hypothetical protein
MKMIVFIFFTVRKNSVYYLGGILYSMQANSVEVRRLSTVVILGFAVLPMALLLLILL